MPPIDEIKRLYYDATPVSIERDLVRAIDLLKSLATEEDRERAAVYMDGLAQMKAEWHTAGRSRGRTKAAPRAAGPGPTAGTKRRSRG
jgi:hypothetical protein